jgi:hypothetical protein
LVIELISITTPRLCYSGRPETDSPSYEFTYLAIPPVPNPAKTALEMLVGQYSKFDASM